MRKKMRKKISCALQFILMSASMAILTACGGADADDKSAMADAPATTEAVTAATAPPTSAPPEQTAPDEPLPTPSSDPDLSDETIDVLTGLYISKEDAQKRPIAVVVNNMHRALPQSGISQASIIYEVLAEGDITRLVAVFRSGVDAAQIGPVRSVRHYFVDFATDYDAILVHHGGSPQGYDAVQDQNIADLDGMRDWYSFWRDPVRVNQPGMYEHSSYTSPEKIIEGITQRGYRDTLHEDADIGYKFFDDKTPLPRAKLALVITVPFSESYQAIFRYDAYTGLYDKFNESGPHIDENTGERLEFTNVLIQQTAIYGIAGDTYGRREAVTIGAGKGYLATNGAYVPVTWKRESRADRTRWFWENGEEIRLNKGKTYICVVSPETKVSFGN